MENVKIRETIYLQSGWNGLNSTENGGDSELTHLSNEQWTFEDLGLEDLKI